MKKAMTKATVAFFFVFVKKKKTITFVTCFDGFVAKNGDGNYHRHFPWFCYKEGDNNNVVTFFYGGGVVKKAMAIGNFFLFFLLFFLGVLLV